MKHQFIKGLILLIVAIFTVGTFSIAGETVKLTLIEGKKFTDYEMTDQSRKKSLEIIERDFNKLFTKISAKHLVNNEKMEVDITNVDLPGIFLFAGGRYSREIRIVDSHSPFKLYFNYRILSSDGKIVKEGEYKIKEFFDSGISTRNHNNHGTVGYYEAPLKKWFKKTFEAN